MFSISILGVIVAAIACFVLGFLIHGPLFGRLWMRLADIHPTGNEKFSDMYGQMFWNFVSNLISALVLAVLVNIIAASTVFSSSLTCASLTGAVILWLVITSGSSMEVIWMKRKISHWLFEVISSLACFVVMGIIIAAI